MSSFSGRVALITGAASGLGRQLALQLAEEGATIAALDRNAAGLESLQNELRGKSAAVVAADVCDVVALRSAVAQMESLLGPMDMLIAGAGIGMATPAVDFHAEDFAALVNVNLIGVANSISAVLPGMLARGRGHIVAISSLASFRGMPRGVSPTRVSEE